jgi:hypothetical protein
MSEPTTIQSALRRLTRPDRAPAFAALLGFHPSDRVIPRGQWPHAGTATPLRTIRIAGTLPGAELVFLGFARNPDTAGVARIARAFHAADPMTHRLYIATASGHDHVVIATLGLEGEIRHLSTDRRKPRASDLETLAELVAPPDAGPTALTIRHTRALDRARVTRQFFDDVRARRDAIARAWRGIPRTLSAEREQLALLLLCRFMFLYFLQRRGHLADDPHYLGNRLARFRRNPAAGSFYRQVAIPLFFGALNTRPENRAADARALGRLPYLNGGLFEPHALERRYPTLDLPDPPVFQLFDQLLERYRFTTRDAADDLIEGAHDVGIDPEMLGRVFEGLMAADRRGDTGTFYTPSATVDRLVADTLAVHLAPDDAATSLAIRSNDASALPAAERRRVRRTLPSLTVLDPACGSGAFLLGALSRIARLRAALDDLDDSAIRRDIVGNTLHGVDLQGDAALLCALRLWLALAETAADGRTVQPLPNLDRQVRQGDALLDPLELGRADLDDRDGRGAAADPAVRAALRSLHPLTRDYLAAEPGHKEELRRQIANAETDLAKAWIRALDHRLERTAAELAAAADARDFFGEHAAGARAARASLVPNRDRRTELLRLERSLADDGTMPFFSFPIHFAHAAARGFDLVLCNPPWVRSHRWPAAVGPLVRRRYEVCSRPGWTRAASLTGTTTAAGGQVDLSLLFLERGLGLLRHGGTLGMLLPAKLFRSLYAAPARRMLLQETRIASVEDHGLDHRSIFRADAFAAAVVARKCPPDHDVNAGPSSAEPAHADRVQPPGSHRVRVDLVRRGQPTLRCTIPQHDLPLFRDDPESPWLLAPDDVRHAIRKMQLAGRPLAESNLRTRRGAFTGANDVLLVRECTPRIGGLATIRTTGFFDADTTTPPRDFEGTIESACLRPVVRGADITPWRFRTPRHVIWIHGQGDGANRPPPRLARFLARHTATLENRTGNTTRPGGIFRVTPDTIGPKVAWHDLADQLEAVAIPATVRSAFGTETPVVPLNTVYFIPTPDWDAALTLSALLNSLPLRTFARAIAERAKDARFRFFAWTIAVLPLPADWRCGSAAADLAAIARDAHAAGAIDPQRQHDLDRTAATMYGLDTDDIAAFTRFDAWLRGRMPHAGTAEPSSTVHP